MQADRFEIIGRSPVMQDLFRELKTIGQCDASVLIEGETGVGKNLVARALHRLSPRASRPFVALNAANLNDELFESELFGHVRGAFTGAYGDHKGLARAADGGTLFIDEVSELALTAQAKLLCFLDQQEVRPVGGLQATKVNLRVICATNQDLREAVKAKTFRQDLFYRLRVFGLRVPSLRERREDVPLLVDHFIRRFAAHYGKTIAGVSKEAMAVLMQHDWEGNVRELENEIERCVVLTPDGMEVQGDVLSLELEPVTPALKTNGTAVDGSLLRESRHAAERSIIDKTLKRHRWNVSAAARELGISRVGLTRKLKRLGLHRPGTRPSLASG